MTSLAKFAAFATTSLLSGFIALTPNPVHAVNLELIDSFDANSVDGITFDPATGNLFLAESVIVQPNAFDRDAFDLTILEVDTTGTTINSFTEIDDELVIAVSLSILPNGNLLTSDVIEGRIVEISSTTGEIVPGGIDIQSPILSFFTPDAQDATGIRFNPVNNTIFTANFVTGDLLEIATELDSNGNLIIESAIALRDIIPEVSASGLEVDPETGNFFLADDIDGTNAIYEITPDGKIVSSFDVEDFGFEDPEGLALDPVTRTLYVSFDNDSLEGIEVTQGNKVAAFKIKSVPEPTSILGLLAFGALGIGFTLNGKQDGA